MQQQRLNPIQTRVFFLSPNVEKGEEREMNVNDLELETGLGKGTFGQVYKVKHRQTKKVYAVKIIDKQSIIQTRMVEQIGNEMKIMYQLDHQNIIKLYNHFEHEDKLYLMIQYAVGGSLYERLLSKKKLDEQSVKKYFSQLVEAIEYCHKQNPPIIHRDIKPENILLDENDNIKLADFGWANFSNKNVKRQTYCGSLVYLSPEMILKIGHDINLDLWSLGVLLYELLSGKLPFTDEYEITQEQYEFNIKNLKLKFPVDFPQLAQDLVRKLLKFQPKDRLQLSEIKKHNWIIQHFEKSRPSNDIADDIMNESIRVQKLNNSQFNIQNNQINQKQSENQQVKELTLELHKLEAKLKLKDEELEQNKLLFNSQSNQNVNEKYFNAMEDQKKKLLQQVSQYWEKLKEKEQIIQKQSFEIENLQEQLKKTQTYKQEKKEQENIVQQLQKIIQEKDDKIDELQQQLQRNSTVSTSQETMRESMIVGNQQTQIKEFISLINDLKQKIDNYREIAVDVQELEQKNFILQQELQKWQDKYEYYKQEQLSLFEAQKEDEIEKIKQWKFEEDKLRKEKHEEQLKEYNELLTDYKKRAKNCGQYERENKELQQKFEIERQINQNIEKDLQSYKHLYKNIETQLNQKIKIIKEKEIELEMLYRKSGN